MSDTFAQFERRLDNLERKHRALANGYVARINQDGLITVEPKPARSGLLLRLLLMAAFGLIVFKSVALALIGPVTYAERLQAMTDGTVFERLCAWIMQIDPLSQHVATLLTTLF